MFFPTDIVDLRDFREKKTLHFPVVGARGEKILGFEKASALAFMAYQASRVKKEAVSQGCGELKYNGYHGDDCNEFYVYNDANSFMAYKRNLQSETFCERHHFCWNHTVVSRHEDYIRCKCLGHAVDAVSYTHLRAHET